MSKQILKLDKTITLEAGGQLSNPQIAFHTFGKLNKQRDNVVWVCHALTASSDVLDWWKGLFGPEELFNPTEHFIVCANMLGSHYGTTNPLSVDLNTGELYYHDFPNITIRDMVQLHQELASALGISRVKVLIGGSMGGQQALEWAIEEPDRFDNLISIASNAAHSPWGIAFNASQRLAIANDPTWERSTPTAGLQGMKVARSLALLSYRNFEAYGKTQQEENCDLIYPDKPGSYQAYQGEKLALRFNAFSYWQLSKAMDSHNVGRQRGGISKALSRIQARTLVISMEKDVLFPIEDQEQIVAGIPKAAHRIIPTSFGHDGFLIETQALSRAIGSFLRWDRSAVNVPALPVVKQSNFSDGILPIGLLGFGNVGRAFFDQLKDRDDVFISKVAVRRQLKGRKGISAGADLFTRNGLDVVRDPSIPIIVELIDDDEAALTYAEEALKRGKVFITANKKMLAQNILALRDLELIHGGQLLYEAAVAGAIPILRSIREYYQSEPIRTIQGIINGSTNYILSRMTQDRQSFGDALGRAQELGFAESNPSLDVDAHDPVYKAVLLAYNALGVYVPPGQVERVGISELTLNEIDDAAAAGKKIKLISRIAHDLRGGVNISVKPRLVGPENELYHIEDELNAVAVEGLYSEVNVFKGRGAGGHPTASAVVADLDFALPSLHAQAAQHFAKRN